jgi:hypothetical protein
VDRLKVSLVVASPAVECPEAVCQVIQAVLPEAQGNRAIQAAMLARFRAAALKLKVFHHRQVQVVALVVTQSLPKVKAAKAKVALINPRNGKTTCLPRTASVVIRAECRAASAAWGRTANA